MADASRIASLRAQGRSWAQIRDEIGGGQGNGSAGAEVRPRKKNSPVQVKRRAGCL